jgi:hypothetical protein
MQFHDAALVPHGHFRLQILRRGVVVDVDDHPNIIVTLAKQTQARLIGGDVTNRSITQIGVGTGSGAAAVGNTGLTSGFLKTISGVTYPTTNSVEFAFSIGASEANGLAIREFGLFTAGGTLFARRVRSGAITKDSELVLSGTWTITY